MGGRAVPTPGGVAAPASPPRYGPGGSLFQQALDVARLWQGQGQGGVACELLAASYSWFTEGFDTADLLEARGLLEEWG